MGLAGTTGVAFCAALSRGGGSTWLGALDGGLFGGGGGGGLFAVGAVKFLWLFSAAILSARELN